MIEPLNAADLAALAALDTPTICNALELPTVDHGPIETISRPGA